MSKFSLEQKGLYTFQIWQKEESKKLQMFAKKVMDFGAFVEVFPGTEGLVHISNLAEGRVEKVTDVCKEGDIVTVKATGVDRRGKIQLSIKDV